jgi:hypothetical protein
MEAKKINDISWMLFDDYQNYGLVVFNENKYSLFNQKNKGEFDSIETLISKNFPGKKFRGFVDKQSNEKRGHRRVPSFFVQK